MSRIVFIEKKALNEMKQADEWYFEKSVVASENLEKEIREMIELLKDERMEHRKIFHEVHIVSMKIFPYNLYYVTDKNRNEVKIIAFLHIKRNPEFIEERIKSK